MSAVGPDTQRTLAGIARGEAGALEGSLELRGVRLERTGLDARTNALVQVAVLIALDAPPASYAWQVSNALDAGATADEIVGVLRAVALHVGGAKAVAAAPEIMLALGLSLPDGEDERA